MKNTRKGFTLVELLVVIAILAVLATVSIVGYTSFINRANDSVAQQELTQIRDYYIAGKFLVPPTELSENLASELELSGKLEKGTVDGEECYKYSVKTGAAYWFIDSNKIEVGVKDWVATTPTDPEDPTDPPVDPNPGETPDAPHTHDYTHTPATCTTPAKCECGESDPTGAVDSNNHAMTDVAEVPATCTTPGTEAGQRCTREGCTHTTGLATIPAAHNHSTTWSNDETQHWHECTECGDKADLANHNWANYVCSECGEVDLSKQQVESLFIVGTTGVLAQSKESISWTGTNVVYTNDKHNSSTAIRTEDSAHYRQYIGSKTTISCLNMTKVVLTCTNASNVLQYSSITDGVDVVVDDNIVTITVISGTLDKIEFVASVQWRINKVDVYYLGEGNSASGGDSGSGNAGATDPTEPRTYTFSNYGEGTQYANNEVHKLDDVVTMTTTQCHFTSELRIYSSSTHNGYAIITSDKAISSISVNAGNNSDKIQVFGSTSGSSWTLIGEISVTSSYKDYTLDFGGASYKYLKLDVAGGNQVRVKTMTLEFAE